MEPLLAGHSMTTEASALAAIPRSLDAYPAADGLSLLGELSMRAHVEPLNLVASGIFVLAIIHTFSAGWFTAWAHSVQHAHDARADAAGETRRPSLAAELMHFLGEVEVVFGLWAIALGVALFAVSGWETVQHYLDDTVNYTEAMFVVVIMALASTRPIVTFAETALRRVAAIGSGTPAAWWVTILTLGPLLGSLVTEPAAMTISALLLGRQFYDRQPSTRLKYATLGLLFVNVSIGGTLTHFAAPPVLMVARPWDWNLAFMLGHFGWRAVLAIAVSTAAYFIAFRRELRSLAERPDVVELEDPDEEAEPAELLPVPFWLVAIHIAFMAWTVVNAHYPSLFVGGFLFFLGFARATSAYQHRLELRTPLLVGFFLAGLVIHGGLQGWWIQPILTRLTETPLFVGAALLTSFNDNALVTYLATLVPHLDQPLKVAVVEGAVTGGGLTVIANAPNPAGQAILSKFFGGAVSPLWLLTGAALPTLIAALIFRLS